MTTPQPDNKQPKPRIQGEPLPLDELMDIAIIDAADVESAAEWWDEYASGEWVDALDSKPKAK